MKKIEKVWLQRYPKQKNKLKTRLKQLEQVLKLSPHDDGLMPVQSMDTKKTYLVPIEELILNGLRGDELHKYPEENAIHP